MEPFNVAMSETPLKKVDAQIVRDPVGVCRVMVKRAKYKHWFELGQHGPTDAAFEQALAAGTVRWNRAIEDKTFSKNLTKNVWKYKIYPYICARNDDCFDGPGRFPVNTKSYEKVHCKLHGQIKRFILGFGIFCQQFQGSLKGSA